jgi:site-specific DNA recombinase
MWMGGVVPLGYRVEDRALHTVEDHAEIVRSLFRRYLETGSVVRLKQQLDAEDFRLPVRIDGGGRSTGGSLLSRGMSISSCRTRSTSAGSLIRAKFTRDTTRRS